ncbi:serine/threonine protein kinase [Bhargavaea massiliensis]|uniref:serine/threonine protein kinase n=1 Tax=Bhargavaea massiliensis TaxID=2697500 RepID=UPI001BCFBB29|nr:serine/threonine protein kinase [Bhargavaea massiliensis]
MFPGWKEADEALKNIEVQGHENNQPVTIIGFAEGLTCVGIGTDAAVFRYDQIPNYVFKVYSPKALKKKEVETDVYECLKWSCFFPQYYGAGSNYIVLSFEQGITLYDCLLQGIPISDQVIQDVEDAREFVRSRGLNPRDIHLKNIILQDGRGKIIDVSEYMKEGNDHRWEHLVWAYKNFYPLISGIQMPLWILETIKRWYFRIGSASLRIKNFSRRVSQLFFEGRK